MITFAIKRKLLNGSIRYIIYSLGLVDVIFSLLFLVRITIAIMQGNHGHGISSAGHLSFRFIGFLLTIVQLTTQMAIACERFIIAKSPIIYRNTLANASRKEILLSIWLGSAAVTLAVVIPSIVVGHPRAISIFCLTIYSLAMTLTAGMYIFTFKTVHDNNMQMRKMGDSTGDASKKCQKISQVHEEQLLYMAVRITSTYFILNTPLIVFSTFFDNSSRIVCLAALPCNTANGVFANVAIGLTSLNKVCDPILYFHTRYRTKKARNNQVKPMGDLGLTCVKSTSGKVKAGMFVKADIGTSGKLNSGISGYVNVGASGNLKKRNSRNINTGASENINTRTSGNVNTGNSGNVNTGESGNANAGTSGNVNTGKSGNFNPETSKDINAGRSGNVKTKTSGNFNAGTSGKVNAGYVAVKAQCGEGRKKCRELTVAQSETSLSCDTRGIITKERMGKDDASITRQRSYKKNQLEKKAADFQDIITEVEVMTPKEVPSNVAEQADQGANITDMGEFMKKNIKCHRIFKEAEKGRKTHGIQGVDTGADRSTEVITITYD